MEYRHLGSCGLKVSALSFGTATFGGSNDFFKAWGAADVDSALRQVDIALCAGINLFDTADAYSRGLSEEILARALGSRRNEVLLATKATYRMGDGPNDVGSSRHHLIRSCEASLRRLNTDYIDLYQLHGFDLSTPVDETLRALDDLVRAGKVRYIACSNLSGWQLMKSLATSRVEHLERYVAHQAYYSLIGREFEWELMPLARDQGLGTIVWSPLGWGRLSGKVRRGQALAAGSRLQALAGAGPTTDDETLFAIVDVLDQLAEETGHTVPQVAINWLLQRPTVSSVIIGARTDDQLIENLGAVGWALTPAQVARLDAPSQTKLPYPYGQHRQLAERDPFIQSPRA
jgi:aryl-alcohol dehydrogenase-like predicted oxidoreductase